MPRQVRTFLIVNTLGLHARAAAQLVQTANRYRSEVLVEKDGMEVNGKSIMGVLTLAAAKGAQITVSVEGDDSSQALEALAKIIITPGASPKEEIRVTPITRTIEGKEHKISLGKFGQFSGHLVDGGLGGSVKITNPPGADPLHHEYLQGQTTTMTYNDAGQNWKFEGSNYMFGTFEVDNERYEKFAAGLAQKMAGMKKN